MVGFLVAITLVAVCLFLMWRSDQVYHFRVSLIEEEFQWMKKQPNRFSVPEWDRCYRSLPSYDRMLYAFWIPLLHYKKPFITFYPELRKPCELKLVD